MWLANAMSCVMKWVFMKWRNTHRWTGSYRKNWIKFKTSGNIPIHFRVIYRIFLNPIKESQRMLTCSWLVLETLESLPIMPKNFSGHCFKVSHWSIIKVNLTEIGILPLLELCACIWIYGRCASCSVLQNISSVWGCLGCFMNFLIWRGITIFSYMVVFHFIFSLWHGPHYL